MAQSADEPAAQKLKDKRWQQMMEALAAMRIAEKGDVILVCGNKHFYAHKWVLESVSPYFVAIFSSELDKINSGRVVFNDIEPETLDAILDFIYLGDVVKIQTEEQFKKVLAAAHLLQLKELFQFCFDSLGNMLSISSFFETAEIARKYHKKDLEEKIRAFWIANAVKLVVTKQFLRLSAAEMKDHINIVKSDSLSLDSLSLDVMVKGLLSWLCYDLKVRETFVGELFACIDTNLVSKDCIISLLKDEIVMNASEVVADKIKQLARQALISSPSPESPQGCSQQAAKPVNDPMSGRVAVNQERVKLRRPINQPVDQSFYQSTSFSWATKLTYFSRYRIVNVVDPSNSGFTMARTEEVKCIQQFDLPTMSWLPLQIPQLGPSGYMWSYIPMCQYGRYIYMIGGRNNWGVHGTYDVLSNNFEPTLSPKFSKGMGTKMFCFKNCLFTVGGYQNNELTKSVYYAEAGSVSWHEGCSLNYAQINPIVLASANYIYVIGDNPRSKDEIIIEFSHNPDKGQKWVVTNISKQGLDPNRCFIFKNALHALYFGEEPKLVVFDHVTKKMETVGSFSFPQGLTEVIELSQFQNSGCPFVFFSQRYDYFSIPVYHWEPETGRWTKLPVQKGKCHIPNHHSVKLVYSVENWD